MKKYGFIEAFFRSFYSRRLYRDVAKHWGADSALYLFLLLAVTWGILMFPIQTILNQSQSKIVDTIAPQIPVTIIKDGEIKTPENRPYVIRDPDNHEIFAIIDTSGQYTDIANNPAQFLITKTQLIYKDHDNNVQIQPISKKINTEIKPDVVKEKITHYTSYAWVILLPIFLLISFIYRIIQALIYALFGKLFSVMAHVPLHYTDILKLSMVSVTPAIVIATVMECLDFAFHFQWLFYFILSIGYLFFAVYSNKTRS